MHRVAKQAMVRAFSPPYQSIKATWLTQRCNARAPADNGGSAAAGVASLASHLLLVTAASQVAANFVGAVVSFFFVGANQSLPRPTTIVEEDENVNEVASSSSSSGASSGQLPRPVSSHVRTDTGDAGADADGEEDSEESDAFEAASAEERSQHAMRLKTHLAVVKEWARKTAAAGLK